MSGVDDMSAVNDYFIRTAAVTPAAVALKDQWRAWYDGLGMFTIREDSTYDEARNRRNAFNLANAVTVAEKAQVDRVVKTGQSTEQSAGEPDRRDSNGNYIIPPPPVVSTETKVIAGVFALLALVLVIKKL